jgi:hypothetical protein
MSHICVALKDGLTVHRLHLCDAVRTCSQLPTFRINPLLPQFLKMETLCCFETLVAANKSTRRLYPQVQHWHIYRSQNLSSQSLHRDWAPTTAKPVLGKQNTLISCQTWKGSAVISSEVPLYIQHLSTSCKGTFTAVSTNDKTFSGAGEGGGRQPKRE